MLDLILIIAFTVIAIRTSLIVIREAAVFREFNQSRSLALLVFLVPLGPIVYLVSVHRLGWLVAALGSAACYVPAFVAARRRLSAFDRAGTDRVNTARNAASHVVGAAIVGLVYCAVALAFTLVGATTVEPSF